MPFIGGSGSALQVSLSYEAACVIETAPLPGPDQHPALRKHLRLRSGSKSSLQGKESPIPFVFLILCLHIPSSRQTLKEPLCLFWDFCPWTIWFLTLPSEETASQKLSNFGKAGGNLHLGSSKGDTEKTKHRGRMIFRLPGSFSRCNIARFWWMI